MANRKDRTPAQQRRARERADARKAQENRSRNQEEGRNIDTTKQRSDYNTNYATDADRALTNRRGSQERREERATTWDSQGDAFDLNTYGKGHVSGQEMQRMKDGGMSMEDIQSKTDGMVMTKRADKKLNRMKAKEKAVAVVENPIEPAVETPNTEPATDAGTTITTTRTPKPTTWQPMPAVEPGVTEPTTPAPPTGVVRGDVGGQTIGGDTGNVGKVGDMTTTIGDGNTIIGSPIGNDYSVTIGNTGNMDGGGGGLSSMMSAAAYSALNNNAHAQSKSQLNGTGRAATASASAALTTGATDRVANLYNMVGQSQMYWKNKANSQQGLYLGDVWNQGGHDWTQAPNPKSTEDRTSDILNDDDDD